MKICLSPDLKIGITCIMFMFCGTVPVVIDWLRICVNGLEICSIDCLISFVEMLS